MEFRSKPMMCGGKGVTKGGGPSMFVMVRRLGPRNICLLARCECVCVDVCLFRDLSFGSQQLTRLVPSKTRLDGILPINPKTSS
jgi:hypothetical protein